jgi:putative spermidine/putrescine transport system substrate-binding protein
MKKLFILFAIVMVAVITACNFQSQDKNELVIATFGGDWGNAQRKVWFDEIEKEFGVKIIDIEYNGDYNLIKLKAGSGEWDIIDIEELEMLRGVKDNLWEPINYDNINQDDIIENAALEYAVGNVGYSIVLGFDSDMFSPEQITGWSSFFSKDLKGKRGFRTAPQYIVEGIWLANNPTLDLYTLPIEESKTRLENYFTSFKQSFGADNIVTFETYGQPQDLIKRKTVSMAYGTNGRMMAEKLDGANIGVCWDESILTIEYYVISRNSKNKELAQKFISFILDKENQANMGRFIPYGPVNQRAFDELTEEERSLLPTSPEIYPRTVLYNADWWLKHEREIRQIYREFLLTR